MKRFFKTLFISLLIFAASYAASELYRAPIAGYSKDVPALDSSTPSMSVDVSPYER